MRRSGSGIWLLTIMSATLILFSGITALPDSNAVDKEIGPITTIYDSLTDNQKKGYDALDEAVKTNTTADHLDYLSISDGETVREAYEYDHPELFWFYDNYTMYVYPSEDKTASFKYTPTITTEQIGLMNKEIDAKLRTLTVEDSDPDYKKLRTIHDWLCDNIVYTDGAAREYDMYGAIVDGKCVCSGYTMAFTYLCHLYGFKCVGITGYTYDSSSIGHAWNLVYGEGDWYFVDVTWDDDENRSRARSDYFMVGSETKINGRVFATEDHMADSLYGITPAKSRYISPESERTSHLIIATIVIIVAIVAAIKIRSIVRRRKTTNVSYYVPDGEQFVAVKCPACGARIDQSNNFCPVCGEELNNNDRIQDEN